MNKVGDFLEEKVLPVAAKLSSNKFLIAIRDGITLSMPLIIIGSIFMVIASFPVPGWEAWLGDIGVAGYLWKGVDSSFGLVGLISAFGIAYSIADQHKTDGISAGIIALSAFIVVTPFVKGETGAGITVGLVGARGLFVAIILGNISGLIYQWFINNKIEIKMPDTVPPAVAKSFSAIIPGAVIITMWLTIFGLLDKFGLPNLHDIAAVVLGKPFGLLGNNIIGTIIVVAFNSIFWFLGIHGGHVVNSIMKPIWIANLDANRLAYQAGDALKHIITEPFMDNFVYIGGGGATIGLVLAIAFYARKKNTSLRTKALAPITVVPGLFNINEPTMFGLPVVLNLLLIVPFILAPMLNALITYFAMASGLVPLTRSVATWTMPPVISGFLTTGSIRGSILQVILIALDILLYLPFFAMVEKGFKAEETAEQ
ncbi:PTS sugar transporter subunit IIC [Erysipelothrix rhusiopathiae]|uniref:PTS sugar transporter subunit IIC n=1 Tax=Erysipelothrix rhusiopathiae TaxID=1648 RepID=UPI002B254091|nr:PTS sugar transporter subunit IIC [Erysipelothrix rhusiopathiae]WRB92997.1 PTS sugar transporter subunit IIC [Erysipelothrix rhusiopathiae]